MCQLSGRLNQSHYRRNVASHLRSSLFRCPLVFGIPSNGPNTIHSHGPYLSALLLLIFCESSSVRFILVNCGMSRNPGTPMTISRNLANGNSVRFILIAYGISSIPGTPLMIPTRHSERTFRPLHSRQSSFLFRANRQSSLNYNYATLHTVDLLS